MFGHEHRTSTDSEEWAPDHDRTATIFLKIGNPNTPYEERGVTSKRDRGFADSAVERDGFEPSVPLKAPGSLGFRFSFTPTSPLAGNQLRSGRSERSPNSYWRGLRRDLTLDRDGLHCPG